MTLTFDTLPDGRERARSNGQIIADIIPDGMGKGGWVTLYAASPRIPRWVRTREEGRAFVREHAGKRAAG